jgi:UDP-N-acetylmuramyl pentapeptide phosphotransferase/UDP-N-acetylglucosamine-1-phosphate transferase
MTSFSIALLISFIACALIIRISRTRGGMSWDDDRLGGVQKFHAFAVPRVGGIAVALALAALGLWLFAGVPTLSVPFWLLLAGGAPALLTGLAEDVTKRVGVLTRLVATMVSGALAFFWLGAEVRRVDIPLLDGLLLYNAASLMLTSMAVGGLANAMNIIDGYNGLAAVVASAMFLSLAYVGLQVGDPLVVASALASAGALVGFLVWNWPRGLIFLGDGGAYFVGYLLAVLVILLVVRHPEVSAWYALVLFVYPVFETVFSIWRRRIVRGASPGLPDGLHLHTLIFRRMVRWAVGRKEAASLTLRNSLTAPYLWALSSFAVLPASLLWRHTLALQIVAGLFCVLYLWLYARLVRFRAPRLLVIRSKKGGLISRWRDF